MGQNRLVLGSPFDLGYRSSAAVTRHVAVLESRAGVQLLARDEMGKRTAKLTEAGWDALGIAGELL